MELQEFGEVLDNKMPSKLLSLNTHMRESGADEYDMVFNNVVSDDAYEMSVFMSHTGVVLEVLDISDDSLLRIDVDGTFSEAINDLFKLHESIV